MDEKNRSKKQKFPNQTEKQIDGGENSLPCSLSFLS